MAALGEALPLFYPSRTNRRNPPALSLLFSALDSLFEQWYHPSIIRTDSKMFFKANDIRVAYDDHGTGLPLVFLHAFPLNRSMWAPQIAELSQQFRTITIDLRGHGESDAALWNFSLELYADDVCALLDHLGIPQTVLVGLSMGGYISLAFSQKYGNRLKALVLADTRAQADSADSRTGRFNLAQTAISQGPGAVADIMLPKLLGPTSLQTKPELVEYVRKTIMTASVSGLITDLMAMAQRPDSVHQLRTITAPALIVIGEEDRTTPLADAQLMAERIPRGRLAVIPFAGHLSNLEQPDMFNDLVSRFVEELR
ncbi:MAG: putative 3-oxoadipate enol-lactonase [Nitrospira sp.]|jgi:pimeloyl-ACP methyl ester carboxylesterase|nr:putative 3-oxoadipate enol-lactonase [Nitrospira sp.]